MKPELDKAGYPLEWPMLVGSDFCREELYDGTSKYCLEGHLSLVFDGGGDTYTGNSDPSPRRKMLKLLGLATKQLGARIVGPYLSDVNDCERNSLRLLSRIWNLAGAMKGYVVDNPETKTLKKMTAK